jgi:1,4-alpha-glucan branching enzyme
VNTGKKPLFMGQEFCKPAEWNSALNTLPPLSVGVFKAE